MAAVQKRLAHGVVPNTTATMYTAPASTRAVIWRATVENVTGAAVVLTLWAVPLAGSEANGNLLIKEQSIPAFGGGPTDLGLANHVIEAGGFIRALAATNNALVLAISGVEVV